MNDPKPKIAHATQSFAGPRADAWTVTDRAVELEIAGRDIIHLGVGDPDFDTPPEIVRAAVTALENGRTHYSPIPGEKSLRAAIAEETARQTGVSVAAGQVTVFPGAQCALFATLKCLAGAGDEVILLEPFYATYEGVAGAGGAKVVTVPMPAANNFALAIDALAQAVTPRTRVILANSPGNPSGAVLSLEDWTSLHALCRANGIWLVSDEVYGSLVFDGVHHSPLSLPGAAQNVVVISSLSKSHAMTGWRLGWSITPNVLTPHLGNLAQCLLFGVSQFTQDAASFALKNSHTSVATMKAVTQSRRDLLCARLESIDGLVVHRPAGGMFVMVDVSPLGVDGETFANELLDRAGVAVVPGFAFGDSVRHCVRIGFLCDESQLRRAADKIQKFVTNQFA